MKHEFCEIGKRNNSRVVEKSDYSETAILLWTTEALFRLEGYVEKDKKSTVTLFGMNHFSLRFSYLIDTPRMYGVDDFTIITA